MGIKKGEFGHFETYLVNKQSLGELLTVYSNVRNSFIYTRPRRFDREKLDVLT